MSFSRNPGSTVMRLRKLRTNNSAPTKRTRETAICETTSMRWNENRSVPAVMPRLPALSAAPGSAREDRNAGARPKIAQGKMAIAATKASTLQSILRLSCNWLSSVLMSRTRLLLNAAARATQSCASGSEYQAFGEQLTDQAPARCSERQPDGHFALASTGPREHKVRKIRAGDEQYKPRNSE